MWSGELGKLKTTTSHIHIKTDAKAVYSATYRAGTRRRLETERQRQKSLDLGVTTTSDAEWSFPVVFVPNTGGHFRY